MENNSTMASSEAPSSGGGADGADAAAPSSATGTDIDILVKPPVKGSWVAELEDAKAALVVARRSLPEEIDDHDMATVLDAHLRLCLAYKMTRQWNQLLLASKQGLKACASAASSSTTVALRLPDTGDAAAAFVVFMALVAPVRAVAAAAAKLFREMHSHAIVTQSEDWPFHEELRDRVLTKRVNLGLTTFWSGTPFVNTTMLSEAVIKAEIRWMEVLVELGAPIDKRSLGAPGDQTFEEALGGQGPTSALLYACVFLAETASRQPEEQSAIDHIEKIVECTMQLVHLGADPLQVMPHEVATPWRRFEGKTAFQISAMTKRRPVADLLSQHMQLSPEERAEIVHCRCGSRLPWKQCHATGVGQPPHYVLHSVTSDKIVTCYRISPHAPCPCKRTNKEYYKCCWKDNRIPVYLDDETGEELCRMIDALSLPSMGRCLRGLATDDPAAASVLQTYNKGGVSWIKPCAGLFREHRSLFAALCEDVGPKSRMTDWDSEVYAGCLERLPKPFLWRDVHWDVDHATLVWQSEEWNKALDKYCNDSGLEGAEREHVVSTHAANPCGPCGHVGCSATEGEVREFRRCAGCRAISYCSRECQKKDRANHQLKCQASQVAPAGLPELLPYEGNAPIDLG